MATANQQKFEREKREMEQNHQSQVLMHLMTVKSLRELQSVFSFPDSLNSSK